ncbi:hypothetical protein DFR50_14427 [Roseiarcus fermentans]|uniref:Uncharacterized protein n=1 Tax=Roseiarcus fermentans TaxID=1473586 RepID=A0A366EM82_9HYPH|nr:hypothetical protein DFR50_14427 [Roseiarcus fermentans]
MLGYNRHCEPKAKQSMPLAQRVDCFVAALLAMTDL